MTDAITQIANTLMTAVAKSGCIRSADQDGDIAIKVMREELKAFLDRDSLRYADERELVMTGRAGLAMASLTATCIERILKERAQ